MILYACNYKTILIILPRIL